MNRNRKPVEALTGCAVNERGTVEACVAEVLPRLRAIERSHHDGAHEAADRLAEITERIIRVHLAELDRGCER